MKRMKHMALFLLMLFSSIPSLISGAMHCFANECQSGGKSGCRGVKKDFETDIDCCEQGNKGISTTDKIRTLKGSTSCFECYPCYEVWRKTDGVWSEWSEWEQCSQECGTGIQERTRLCDDPPPSTLGKDCEGDATQSRPCNTHICPVHGKWSAWSEWSPCSTTCGEGRQIKTRLCNNPPPKFGGKNCPGSNVLTKPCSLIEFCPVDGKWSQWSPWSQCSKTCGTGFKQTTRTCTQPAPRYGGKKCEGDNLKRLPCNTHPCPIHGKWGSWSNWGSCVFDDCDKSEKGGYKVRTRSCDNPRPRYKGQMCKGSFFDHQFCVKSDNCPIDGGWTQWSNWDCTSCIGTSRVRNCTNPEPKFGGEYCDGTDIEMFNLQENEREVKNLCSAHCKFEKGDVSEEPEPEPETQPPPIEDENYPDNYALGAGGNDDNGNENYADENADVYGDGNNPDMYSD